MTIWEFFLSIIIVAVPALVLHWFDVLEPWSIVVGPVVAFVWFLIGCIVLAGIDEDGRLFDWAKRCPLGFTFVPLLWPFVAWKYLRGPRN